MKRARVVVNPCEEREDQVMDKGVFSINIVLF